MISPFADCAVIPLSLPPPPVTTAELRSFTQHHVDRCAFSHDVCRYLLAYARRPVFDGQAVLHSGDPRLESGLIPDAYTWDPAFAAALPALVTWFEALPFRTLAGIDLVTQTADLDDHLDVFGPNNSVTYWRRHNSIEPIYYRVLFTEPDDTAARISSFYVSRDHGGPRDYVQLPDGVSTIAMSSSVCYHGATHRPGHFKVTAVVYGELEPAAHLALLESSLERHADHAVRYAEAGPVRGPGAVLPYVGGEHS